MNKLIGISGVLVLGTLISGCETPTPPSISEQDVQDAITEFNRISALSQSSSAEVAARTGSAQFSGSAGGEFLAGSDVDGGFLGDMSATIDFDAGTVSGTIDNVNTVEDEVPQQLLSGSLGVSGSISGTSLSATASGTLTGVDGGFKGDSTGTYTLSGNFQNDTGTADVVSGSMTGSGDGDFYVNVDGDFYIKE